VIVIKFSLFSNEQGVLSLCEEIDRERLRNFFGIVYPLSVDLVLSAQSSRAKASLLALSASTPDWLAE